MSVDVAQAGEAIRNRVRAMMFDNLRILGCAHTLLEHRVKAASCRCALARKYRETLAAFEGLSR